MLLAVVTEFAVEPEFWSTAELGVFGINLVEISGDCAWSADISFHLANAGVICGDPRPAAGLMRKNRAMVVDIANCRWKGGEARPFLVAIHGEIKPVRFWNKGNRAHQLATG